ncbi:hypothetical protein ABT010_34575 [Streptomyces sp. NPDC002668]|uniref:hypothetical protein n=1 Tax=Streptomyces sp. NPDC002668 TaxID=3154422 RepID=UPI00331B9385
MPTTLGQPFNHWSIRALAARLRRVLGRVRGAAAWRGGLRSYAGGAQVRAVVAPARHVPAVGDPITDVPVAGVGPHHADAVQVDPDIGPDRLAVQSDGPDGGHQTGLGTARDALDLRESPGLGQVAVPPLGGGEQLDNGVPEPRANPPVLCVDAQDTAQEGHVEGAHQGLPAERDAGDVAGVAGRPMGAPQHRRITASPSMTTSSPSAAAAEAI